MCEAKWVICGIGAAAVIVVILTTAIHFTSGGNNEICLGEGNDVANIKESSGIHLIEVDASNNNGWSVLEVGFVILAIKLGLILSHALQYCFHTKKLVKKKVAKAVNIEMLKLTPPVVIPGILEVLALP